MPETEICVACGRAISTGVIPRRVLGRVLCPPCDDRRIRELNRRDRVPVFVGLVIIHAAVAALTILLGIEGVFRWWGTQRIQPEEVEVLNLFIPLLLFPVGGVIGWACWSVWRLEGKGRLATIFLDGLLAVLGFYWLLQGHALAIAGLVALFSCWYFCRSSTADRFW
jgi:hypothetical protein